MKRTLAAFIPAVLLSFYAPSLQAQSLEPPPPLPPPGPPGAPLPPPGTPTATDSNAADESQDSGLGLEWVWLNADVGASFVNTTTFNESQLALQQVSGAGPTFGIGAGVRLLFLTAGLRARDSLLSSLGSLWELNAEAALHMRIWRIDPYFGIRGGYAFIGSLNSESVQVATQSAPSGVTVHGFNVGPMVGIDIYLSSLVSIGGEGDLEFLFLQRPPVPLPAGISLASLPPQYQTLYQSSGNSAGLGGGATAHLGIHF